MPNDDKQKIAKVISSMLGGNAAGMTPEQAINAGLKNAKSKHLSPDLLGTLKQMVQLAKDNGMKITEELVTESWASTKSHADGPGKGRYLGDMDHSEHKAAIAWHKDQYKKAKSKTEKVGHIRARYAHEDAANSWSKRNNIKEGTDILSFGNFIKKKTAPQSDNIEGQEETETGSTLQPDSNEDDDQLRRRKVDYRISEDVEEDEGSVEDSEDEEFSDKELDSMAKEIDDEEDILDLYDEDEIALVDDETGEVVGEAIDESALMEVMSRAERYKARMKFMKSKTKRERKVKIALHKRSDSKTLNKRARRLAVQLIKERIMKKKTSEMSVSEKERVETIVSKRKKAVDRLAMRLIPRIRKIENERMTHTKDVKNG